MASKELTQDEEQKKRPSHYVDVDAVPGDEVKVDATDLMSPYFAGHQAEEVFEGPDKQPRKTPKGETRRHAKTFPSSDEMDSANHPDTRDY